jgi:hypothetical protein
MAVTASARYRLADSLALVQGCREIVKLPEKLSGSVNGVSTSNKKEHKGAPGFAGVFPTVSDCDFSMAC